MANTTADKLALAIQSKEKIRAAIEEMGGTFDSEADAGKLSAFDAAVRSIPTGGADMTESLDAATPANIKPGFLRIVKAPMTDALTGTALNDRNGNPLYTYSLHVWTIDEANPNGHFVAATGAYNAKDVYFDDDLLTTSAIGNITLSNGQATIAAKGKNLPQVFETIFVKEVKTGLKTKNPYVKTNISSTEWVQIGSEAASKDVTITFYDGTYKYGPTPGCTATAYYFNDVSNENNPTKTITGDFSKKGYTTVAVKASYSAAAKSPISNTGNVIESEKFGAGTAYAENKSTALSVNVYGCYVPLFWGFKDSSEALATPAEITASDITSLGNSITGAIAYTGAAGEDTTSDKYAYRTALTAPKPFQQLFYAVPSGGKQLTEVVDKNGLPLTVNQTSAVEVTLGSAKQNYIVYYVALDANYDTLDLILTWA